MIGPSSASGSRVPPHRIMASVLEITSSMRSAASGRPFDAMDALPSMLLVLHSKAGLPSKRFATRIGSIAGLGLIIEKFGTSRNVKRNGS